MSEKKHSVMIVDDEIMVIRSIVRVLGNEDYNYHFTTDPTAAVKILGNTPIDVIISDQRMPHMTGLELLMQAKRVSPASIRILMSGYSDFDIVIAAINDGQIYQYITKPWNNEKFIHTVYNAIKNKEETDEKERIIAYRLEDTGKWTAMINQLNKELEIKKENSVNTLLKVLKAKDYKLYQHSAYVAETAVLLAGILKLQEDQIESIRYAGLFHDIGKISIRDKIMYKDGSLNDEEYEQMKNHPTVGSEILREVDFLGGIADIVVQHHERIDGKGYPKGMKQNEIMLESQIISVADSFEALIENRVYRDKMETEDALKILAEGKGSRYNADVVDALVALTSEKLYCRVAL